jgi:hypothetical protein
VIFCIDGRSKAGLASLYRATNTHHFGLLPRLRFRRDLKNKITLTDKSSLNLHRLGLCEVLTVVAKQHLLVYPMGTWRNACHLYSTEMRLA